MVPLEQVKAWPATALLAALSLCLSCTPRAAHVRSAESANAAQAPRADLASATPDATPTSDPPLDDSGDTDGDSDSDEGDNGESASPPSAVTVPHPLDGWSYGEGNFAVPSGLNAQLATNGHKKVKWAVVGS